MQLLALLPPGAPLGETSGTLEGGVICSWLGFEAVLMCCQLQPGQRIPPTQQIMFHPLAETLGRRLLVCVWVCCQRRHL